ncbi:single-stranded DNA-binding protein [Brevibacillus sp. JB24b]|uniref:single-stranded DNA-binding protein n=1 Tax=Brevibacillus sp. JB24b TaxID=3422308 RepID=UPI003F6849D7
MNKVFLIGRLTKDPELRYTPNGVAVATFTLAVDRNFAGTDGRKEADFIGIVAWKQLADLCANYLAKGRQCAVDGRIQTRSYDNKEGKRVYVTEIVAEHVQFLGGSKGEQDRQGAAAQPSDPFYSTGQKVQIKDEDLPF